MKTLIRCDYGKCILHNWAQQLSKDKLIMAGFLTIICLFFAVFVIFPLFFMLQKSMQNNSGDWVGLTNFIEYFVTGNLWSSVLNTFKVSILVTLVVSIAAFIYAFALTRSCMPFKSFFEVLGMGPVLAPSLLPAISLVFLFGNQGIFKHWLGDVSIYGVLGMSLGLIFWTFPHALVILINALRTSDARLYEAARSLNLSSLKTFLLVTLPTAKYGLISASIVVFSLVLCDFGVAKVIGGDYSVLATDIFKQVVGQHDFSMGAVISLLLLLPSALAFSISRWVQSRQKSLMENRSVIYKPKPHKLRDSICLIYCLTISTLFLVVLGMAIYGSLVSFWPWNTILTLNNYNFSESSTYGWLPYWNSINLATWTALIGTVIIFISAYCIEKGRGFAGVKTFLQMLSLLPTAVPGMVLGLGYVFFFNHASNPFNIFYGSLFLLAINTVVHYYSVGYLTASSALKQMPADIEATATSIKLPQYKLFFKVSLPTCLPAVLDISSYLFINALNTTSALIFLYSPETMPASLAVLSMDDAGQLGAAAAMAVMIMLSAAVAKLIYQIASKKLNKKTQAWRHL